MALVVGMTGILLCRGAGAEPLRSVSDLDGVYVLIGPVASATYVEEAWEGSFGGELGVVRVREHAALAALGVAAGGARFAGRDGGLLWLELVVGTGLGRSTGAGVALGADLQLDEIEPARPGAHATAWLWAGVTPYVRVGYLEESGTFFDAGVKLTLPARRF